jgi:hypothetical protein
MWRHHPHKDFAAEVRSGEGDRERVGSGYLISPHLVLTARHVVRHGGDVRVRLGVPPRTEAVPAKVAWVHEALDVVLLRIEGDPSPVPPRLRWLRAHWAKWMSASFVTYAFPHFGPRGIFLDGRMSFGPRAPGFFEVDFRFVPRKPESWGGVSGANLFVWGRLVGVVSKRGREQFAHVFAAPFESLMADPEFARHLREDQPPPRTGCLKPSVFVSVLLGVAFLLGVLVWPPALPGCPPPVELVVSTTADQRPALTRAMAEYVDDRARQDRRGCVPVRVSVGVAGGADETRALLARGWRGQDQAAGYRDLTMGPRPHVWLPDSSADLALLEHAAEEEGESPEMIDHGPTRITPLVMGLPASGEPLGACSGNPAGAANVSDCLTAVEEAGLRLARPSPHASTSALILTQAVYASDGGTEETRRTEAAVTSAGLEAEGDLGLLCALRRGQVADPAATAVLGTERAVAAYNSGAALEPGCSATGEEAAEPLTVVHLADVADLDHPFVELDWGRDDGVRSEVAALRDWMSVTAEAGAAGAFEGYRTTDGSPIGDSPLPDEYTPVAPPEPSGWADRLHDVLAQQEEVRGSVELLIAIDRSDSMRGPGADGTRLRTAQDRAHGLLSLLGPQDGVGVWAFPEHGSGNDVRTQQHLLPLGERATADRVRQARAHVDSLAADHEATPLTDAVRDGAEEFGDCRDHPDGPGSCVLVVLTDGVALPEPRGAAAPSDLDRLLDAAGDNVLVHVVSVGTEGCGGGLLGRLADAGAQCHPPSAAASDHLPYTIIGRARAVAE